VVIAMRPPDEEAVLGANQSPEVLTSRVTTAAKGRDRYSPVRVQALLWLIEGNARAFVIASAMGRYIRSDGTFSAVRTARDVAGVVIGPTQRERILETLDIDPSHWRRFVRDWTARYVAHHCGRDRVCLFVRPMENPCPACGADIAIDHVAPRPDARRRTGRVRPPETGVFTPPRGTNTPAVGVRTRPQSVADQAHPISGVLQGHRSKGLEIEASLAVPSDRLFEGSAETAPPFSDEEIAAYVRRIEATDA
jgi:hypothetical protein